MRKVVSVFLQAVLLMTSLLNTGLSMDKNHEMRPLTEEERGAGRVLADMVLTHALKNDDALSQSYGGCYFEPNGTLVFVLTANVEECSAQIELLDCSNALHAKYKIKTATFSYATLNNALDNMNQRLGELYAESNRNGLNASDSISLASAFPTLMLDEEQNKIIVGLKAFDDVSFCELIQAFKHQIGDYPFLLFENNPEYEPYKTLSSPWKVGRGIGCSGYGYSSTGYRATFTYLNHEISGFVMAGHAAAIGQTIYYYERDQYGNTISSIPLGVVRGKSFANNSDLDVAFVEITNSDFYPSNELYYTDSQGGTVYYITLAGDYSYAFQGDTIRKTGAASYYTSGTVVSGSVSNYCESDGVYYYITDLIKTTHMAVSGDSGGSAHIYQSGRGNLVVGLVSGSDNNYSYFTKAVKITTAFGAIPY